MEGGQAEQIDRTNLKFPFFDCWRISMRYLSCLLTLVFVAALAAAQTGSKSATDLEAAHLFDYDAKQPLAIHDRIIEEFKGGTLHDITYTSPKGGLVGAYLIVPKGKGPFAAVLFG